MIRGDAVNTEALDEALDACEAFEDLQKDSEPRAAERRRAALGRIEAALDRLSNVAAWAAGDVTDVVSGKLFRLSRRLPPDGPPTYEEKRANFIRGAKRFMKD